MSREALKFQIYDSGFIRSRMYWNSKSGISVGFWEMLA